MKKAPRKQEIIRIFKEAGEPISIAELAARCLRENLWGKEERDRMVLQTARHEVRDVLNQEDIDTLPVALTRHAEIEEGPDGEIVDVKLYVQREFWSEMDARSWVRDRVKQLEVDYSKLERFINGYCTDRWPEVDWWSMVTIRQVEEAEE